VDDDLEELSEVSMEPEGRIKELTLIGILEI
jgi:hypothetical protein